MLHVKRFGNWSRKVYNLHISVFKYFLLNLHKFLLGLPLN